MQMINNAKLIFIRVMHTAQSGQEIIIQFTIITKELKYIDHGLLTYRKASHISEKLLRFNGCIKLFGQFSENELVSFSIFLVHDLLFCLVKFRDNSIMRNIAFQCKYTIVYSILYCFISSSYDPEFLLLSDSLPTSSCIFIIPSIICSGRGGHPGT